MKRAVFAFVITALIQTPALAGESGDAFAPRIGVADTLQIRVITPAGLSLNETYRIDGNGYIRHSMAGRIKLIDLSPDQAETFLERYIVRQGNPDAAVKITVFPSNGVFTVSGAVKNPGQYQIRGECTVAAAIQMAGGLKAPSTGEFTRLIRKGSTTKNFSLHSKRSLLIRPGDEIIVLK